MAARTSPPGAAVAEVGRAGDRPVEARPALAVGERLLDPVEAAEPPAEVVDHVHERRLARARHDRRTVLELPVVGEDDVEHRLRGLRREARQLLDLAPHEVVAERDLALELAGVGELDRAAVHRVRLDLADVVQQRAGDGDVVVDAREGGGERVHPLRDRQAVLEQPVLVGLVVVLRRRGVGPAAPDRRAVGEEAVEQAAQVRVAHGGDQLAQVVDHLVEALDRRVHQVGELERAWLRGPHRPHGDRRPVALLDAEPPRDDHDRAWGGGRGGFVDLVPHHALDHPGAVAELELEERLAVALLPQAAVADHERRLDLLAVGEVADEHLVAGNGLEGCLENARHAGEIDSPRAGRLRPAPGQPRKQRQ